MMSTETAETTACASLGSGPTIDQAAKVAAAAARTTGTKTLDTESARAWTGALLLAASRVILTMGRQLGLGPHPWWPSITNEPDAFRVPPTTSSWALVHGQGFTRDHGLVDHPVPSMITPSVGDLLSRLTPEAVAGLNGVKGHVTLGPVRVYPARVSRGEGEQGANGLACAPAGLELQDLAQKDQGHYHGRRLEVQARRPVRGPGVPGEHAGRQHGGGAVGVRDQYTEPYEGDMLKLRPLRRGRAAEEGPPAP
jgi:hypothetical protein